MPLYDYVCTACGHKVEVMHSVHGDGPTACPACGSPMKKVFAPPTVHYKGTGWARKEKSSGRSGGSHKGEQELGPAVEASGGAASAGAGSGGAASDGPASGGAAASSTPDGN